MLHRFREEVYQSFEQRGDTGLELIDALTSTPGVESPVELRESPLFRRRFSNVYDALKRGRLQYERLRRVLDELQPADAETIAGCEVYAMDCTDAPAPEAETLPERSRTQKGKNAPTVVGHRYSWLVRLVKWRTSWCMPQDIERVTTTSSDSQVGANIRMANSFIAMHRQHPLLRLGRSAVSRPAYLNGFASGDALSHDLFFVL